MSKVTVRTHASDQWLWIAERDGVEVGKLAATPCHYLTVMLERLEGVGSQHGAVGFELLKAALEDCANRGFKSYFVMLSVTREAERRLLGVLRRRYGAIQFEQPMVVAAGKTRGKVTKEEAHVLHTAAAREHR